MSYIVARVLDRRKEELKEFERDTAALERVQAPFPRISYTDAVARLNALGSDLKWGDDLGGDDETLLAKQYDRPLFVFNYPKQVKAFYMKENPDDPRTVLNNDCLAPEGYGEIIGGSQREDDYDKLLARIREQGLDPEAYRLVPGPAGYGTFVHPGSASASSGRWPGSAGSRTSGRRSRSRGRFTGCIPRMLGQLSRPLGHLTSSHSRSSPSSPARSTSAPAFGQPLQGLETVAEFPVGAVERPAGLHARLPGQVHHGEEEIPISFSSASSGGAACWVGRGGATWVTPQLRLHLRQFLPHLFRRPRRIGPVEPDRRCAFLKPQGHEQVGRAGGSRRACRPGAPAA